jgi:hypothetical protein
MSSRLTGKQLRFRPFGWQTYALQNPARCPPGTLLEPSWYAPETSQGVLNARSIEDPGKILCKPRKIPGFNRAIFKSPNT